MLFISSTKPSATRAGRQAATRQQESAFNSCRPPHVSPDHPLRGGAAKRAAICGLGIILPDLDSLPLGQEGHEAVVDRSMFAGLTAVSYLNSPGDSSNERSRGVLSAPQTPVLEPLDFGEEISPILPLPPSVYCIHQSTCVSGAFGNPVDDALPSPKHRRPAVTRLSTAEYILTMHISGPVGTQDITTLVLNDDRTGSEDVRALLASPVPETPTVDIADQDISLLRMPLRPTSFLENGDYGKEIGGPAGHSPALPDHGRSPTTLSAIPIYHSQPRTTLFHHLPLPLDTAGRSCPKSNPRLATFRSSAIMYDPAVRAHQRNALTRQPIEIHSPSMTPSPVNSPIFCSLPGQEKMGRCETTSGVNVKTGQRRSLDLCAQPAKRWSTKHESVRKNTRCNPWHSPTLRSPRPICALSQSTAQGSKRDVMCVKKLAEPAVTISRAATEDYGGGACSPL